MRRYKHADRVPITLAAFRVDRPGQLMGEPSALLKHMVKRRDDTLVALTSVHDVGVALASISHPYD